jgi:hypothetical protein
MTGADDAADFVEKARWFGRGRRVGEGVHVMRRFGAVWAYSMADAGQSSSDSAAVGVVAMVGGGRCYA